VKIGGLLTSPRSLRGEVEIRAQREFRVRGEARRFIHRRRLQTAPTHPNPLPV
jgi:hypothetical protein